MEIERRWFVEGWPEDTEGTPKMDILREEEMDQGYVTIEPSVRIRREALVRGTECTEASVRHMLNMKSGRGIARKEVEFPIPEDQYKEVEDLIDKPLIQKVRRTYMLPDGLHLEVSKVDEGLPSEFWYAEVEYASVEQGRAWDPAACGLGSYLANDVTDQPGQSMAAYWAMTRLDEGKAD